MKTLQPPGWPRPKGYSNGIAARGTTIFVSGVVGWTAEEKFEAADLVGQVRQALANIVAILAEGGAKPEHLVRMTWYLVDRNEYCAALREIGAVYREIVGRYYPTMTAVEVSGLIEPQARVEIEATAVIPDGHAAQEERTE